MKQKLTSRKFWVAAASIASGILMMFGFSSSSAEVIAGALITLGGAVGYMVSEGIVDAASVKIIVDAAETAAKELKGGEDGEKDK